jgi:hypothetical protein
MHKGVNTASKTTAALILVVGRDGGRDAMHCVSTNYFFPDKRVKTPDFD